MKNIVDCLILGEMDEASELLRKEVGKYFENKHIKESHGTDKQFHVDKQDDGTFGVIGDTTGIVQSTHNDEEEAENEASDLNQSFNESKLTDLGKLSDDDLMAQYDNVFDALISAEKDENKDEISDIVKHKHAIEIEMKKRGIEGKVVPDTLYDESSTGAFKPDDEEKLKNNK